MEKIHICEYFSVSQNFFNKSFGTVPIEVGRIITDTRKMYASWNPNKKFVTKICKDMSNNQHNNLFISRIFPDRKTARTAVLLNRAQNLDQILPT